MHPIGGDVRNRLYNGITKEGLGRANYLKNDEKEVQMISTPFSYAPVGIMAGRCQRGHSTRLKMDEIELLGIHSINDMESFTIQLMYKSTTIPLLNLIINQYKLLFELYFLKQQQYLKLKK